MIFFKKIFKSSLFKESFLYGISGVLSKVCPLLVIPIYISYIGIEGFGILDLYLTIGLAIFIVCEAQAVSGVMRSYYECQKSEELGELIGGAIRIYLTTSFFSLLVFFICFYIFSNVIDLNFEYLLPLFISIFPRQVFSLYTIILRMEHKAKRYVVFNLINVFLTALFGIFFIYFFKKNALSVLYGISFSQVLMGGFSIYYISRIKKIKLSKKYIREIVIYGLPIAISSLAGWLLTSSGRLVVANETSAFELGVYSLTLKIAMVYMVFLQAFRTAWDPYCMKKFGSNSSKEFFSNALNSYWIGGALVATLVYFLSPFFIFILGADEAILNDKLLIFILIGYFWQGGINIISVGNAWARKTYVNLLGTVSGGLISYFFAFFYVDRLGVLSGGLGYLIGMQVSFFIIFVLAQKNKYIPYNYYSVALVLMLSIGLVLRFIT